jgi:hypothetical protein
MGDCWEHQLTLTKPRAADPALAYSRYLAGESPPPPEDCGGIPGFYAQLEVLADPNHPDHDDAKEWFGDFDPIRFDDQPIKDRLARIANRRHSACFSRCCTSRDRGAVAPDIAAPIAACCKGERDSLLSYFKVQFRYTFN